MRLEHYICFADGRGTNIDINPTNGFSRKELADFLSRYNLEVISEYRIGPICNVLVRYADECQECNNM